MFLQDDTLTVFPGWIRRLCDLLRAGGLGLAWACNTRADTAGPELLREMRDAGLVKIKVGIESISDRVRNGIYRKNVSRERIEGFIGDCRALGIQVTGFFMLGAPTETAREVRDTIRFAVRSGLAEANFSIATPLPETGLYDYVRERGWSLPTGSGGFDYYQVRRPRMGPGEIGLRHLALCKKAANLLFNLHPKRLRPTLRQLASPAKAARKLRRV